MPARASMAIAVLCSFAPAQAGSGGTNPREFVLDVLSTSREADGATTFVLGEKEAALQVRLRAERTYGAAAELSVPSRSDAAALLRRFAQWLGEPAPPAAHAGVLRPVVCGALSFRGGGTILFLEGADVVLRVDEAKRCRERPRGTARAW